MEHVFNGLPSKQDYVRGVKSFIIENRIAFEEETDGESPTIGFLYDNGPKSVRCDLLIHSRGIKDPDNLLALEMKKKGNDRNVIDDYDRLENITKPRKDSTPKDCVCGTLMGAFLEISSNMYKIDLTWYENDVVRHESRSKSF